MKTCPACQQRNSDDASSCTSCGFRFRGGPTSFQQTKLTTENIESFSPGDLIAGRYEVVRELGRGGMGMVYLAKDTEMRGIEVALKMIHPRLVEHPEASQRFIDEVITCQRLAHPNIVRVYDLKRWEGLQFFTMEYIEGRSLREVITERGGEKPPFSLSEAAGVVLPVLEALGYAHRQTIHRDIKPENILVSGDFPEVTVKILDFGIAKTLSATRFTQTAQALGTAYYMAPEQRSGGQVDHRADLYAVGQVLYELFTGEIADVLPEMPSQLYAELPIEVDQLIAKLLKKEASQRYSNAGEVKAALEKALLVQREYLRKRRSEEEQRKREEEVQRLLKEGDQAFEERRWEQAAGCYQRLLELEPSNQRARHRVAEAQAKQRQMERLQTELREAAGDFPTSLSVLEQLLPLSEEPQVLEEKKAALQRQLEDEQRRQKEEQARQRQARLKSLMEEAKRALRERRWQDAAKVLLQFLVYEPEHGEAKRLLEEVQRRLQVLAALHEALSKGDVKNGRRLLEEAGQLLVGEGELQGYRQRLEKLEEEDRWRHQQDAKSIFNQALEAFDSRDWVKAAQLFRRTIELDPSVARAEELEADAYSKEEQRKKLWGESSIAESSEDFQKALSILEKVKELSGDSERIKQQQDRISFKKDAAEKIRNRQDEEKRVEAAAQKRRTLVTVAAAVCVVLLIGGGIFFYLQKTDKPIPSQAEVLAPASTHATAPELDEAPPKTVKTQASTITKPAEQPPKTAEPVASTGRIVVEAEPAGARVEVLNIKPMYQRGMELEAGSYSVRVSHPKYVTKTERVEVKAGQESVIRISLDVIPVGRVMVRSEPSDAQFDIGGKYTGTTPGELKDIAAGSYRATIKKEGYEDWTGPVEVKAGGSAELQAELRSKAPRAGQTVDGPLPGMKFAFIPPGNFIMGSPVDEKGRDKDETQHPVTMTKGFYLMTTEVTQEHWQAVMVSNPSKIKGCGLNCPVENVSWEKVQEFINRLNQKERTNKYRLPKEAEWEYAARAGSMTAFANGGITVTDCGHDSNLDAIGWYCGNANSTTHAVGQKRPNAWGLYDMHGNVWEWCADWKGDYPLGAVTNPTGPSSGPYPVLRGGCWLYGARHCRSANRNDEGGPGYRDESIGFRLARDQ